jgi:hypothetical protein
MKCASRLLPLEDAKGSHDASCLTHKQELLTGSLVILPVMRQQSTTILSNINTTSDVRRVLSLQPQMYS